MSAIFQPDISRFPKDPASLPARLENMRPGQVRDAVGRGATCLLPVGTLESDGGHAPLGLSAESEKALEALAHEPGAVVAPPILYGPTGYALSGPAEGTFDMPVEAFSRYLEEVLTTLSQVGFRRVEIVPIHNPQGGGGPLRAACKFAVADLFNDFWKDPRIGQNWWERPDRDKLNWNRFGLQELAAKEAVQPAPPGKVQLRLPLRLERMRPSELKEALRRGLPCFVPCGCLENHGNQNPIGCDAFETQDPVVLAAGKAPAVVAPTVWYAPTGYAVTGPELATTDINAQVFRNYMDGVVKGLAAMGFRNIVFVPLHQGSDGPEWTAIEMAIRSYRSSLYKQPGYGAAWASRMKESEYMHANIELISPPHGEYDHAGKNETSWMLHLRPDYTDLKLVRPGDYGFCWQEGDESVKATADWGREMTERTVEALAELIRRKTQR